MKLVITVLVIGTLGSGIAAFASPAPHPAPAAKARPSVLFPGADRR